MKSLISRRRKFHAVCPVCKSPDYLYEDYSREIWLKPPKPSFKCRSCENIWQNGNSGGIYADLLTDEEKKIFKVKEG